MTAVRNHGALRQSIRVVLLQHPFDSSLISSIQLETLAMKLHKMAPVVSAKAVVVVDGTPLVSGVIGSPVTGAVLAKSQL